MSKSNFRLLILGSWALILVAVAAHFIALRWLPVELRGGIEAYKADPQNRASTLKLVLDLLYLVSSFVISVGLFRFRSWAKSLLMPSIIVGLLLGGTWRINVDVQWVTSLKYLSGMLSGVIVALVYWSPLSDMFRKGAV
jgi:hypothetical protein